jgi:hypothetical protein
VDFNANIEARRRQQEESARQHAVELRQREIQQEIVLAQFNDLARKFVQWAKQSGAEPTRYKSVPIPGAKPVQVGRGRNRRAITQTRQIAVWAIQRHGESQESGWGVVNVTVDDIAIHEDGEITWTVGAKTPASLWDYIANFIAASGSTVRWPD